MAQNINCKIIKTSRGVEVLNNKGEDSTLFNTLRERHGETKAIDIIYAVNTPEAIEMLENQINTEGEVSPEVAENYIRVTNEIAVGEINYQDIGEINEISSTTGVRSTEQLLVVLNEITEGGETPLELQHITPERAYELQNKIRNTEDFEIEGDNTENLSMTEDGPRDNFEILEPLLEEVTERSQFDEIINENATPEFVEKYNNQEGFADEFYESHISKTNIIQEDFQGELHLNPNRTTETLNSIDIEIGSEVNQLINILIKNPQNITDATLRQLEELMANRGANFTEVIEMTELNGKQALTELLQSYSDVVVNPTQETIDNFTEQYNNFFNVETVSEKRRVNVEGETVTLTKIKTEDKESLFRDRNLVEIIEGQYKEESPLTINQKVEQTLEEALYEDNVYLPNHAFTGRRADNDKENFNVIDYIHKEGVDSVKINLRKYVRELGDTNASRNIAYYKLKNKELTEKIKNSEVQPIINNTSYVPSKKSNFLKNRFLTEFTSEKLINKIEGTPLYSNFYKFLSVTKQGVRLNDKSKDAIQKVVNAIKELPSNQKTIFIEHLLLTKEQMLTEYLPMTDNVQNSTPESIIDNYVNNSETVLEYKGTYNREGDRLIKINKGNPLVVKIEGKLYEAIDGNQVETTYREIATNEDGFNNITPINRDVPLPIEHTEINKPEGLNKIKIKLNKELKSKLEC